MQAEGATAWARRKLQMGLRFDSVEATAAYQGCTPELKGLIKLQRNKTANSLQREEIWLEAPVVDGD